MRVVKQAPLMCYDGLIVACRLGSNRLNTNEHRQTRSLLLPIIVITMIREKRTRKITRKYNRFYVCVSKDCTDRIARVILFLGTPPRDIYDDGGSGLHLAPFWAPSVDGIYPLCLSLLFSIITLA